MRPRTPIGSYGVINVREVQPGVWRARTLYRFPDGSRRQVERFRQGRTGAKARQALQEALIDIATPVTGDVTRATRLEVLADAFLSAKSASGRAPRTVDTYAHAIRSIIVPRIGDLRIEEATTGRLQAFVTTVAAEHGAGAAKTCRSVLSGMLGLAVRGDVLRSNPITSVESPRKRTSHASSALPLEEVPAFLAMLRSDAELRRLDLGNLFEFMLFTGCRIGEALALRWSHVDLEAATVTFAATVVRMRGLGLQLQEQTKSDASNRVIAVPREVVGLRLGAELDHAAATGNTEADWRANRDRLGYPKLTSHALRKTAATALDVGGASARAIAEYLGHKRPSMTQDVYMSRTVGSAATAEHLDRMFGVSSGSLPGPTAGTPETRGSGGPRGARTKSAPDQAILRDPETLF